MILLDTSAWVEVFRGTALGKKIKSIIYDKVLFTSVLSIAEISKWCSENSLDDSKFLDIIEENSNLIALKREALISGGKLCANLKKKIHNFDLIDACIYTSARIYGAGILTTDHYFELLEGAQIIS